MTYSAMTPEHKICAVADAVVHLRTLHFITRRVKSVLMLAAT